VRTGHPVIRPMRERVPLLPPPTQPPGRAPRPAGRQPRTIPAEK